MKFALLTFVASCQRFIDHAPELPGRDPRRRNIRFDPHARERTGKAETFVRGEEHPGNDSSPLYRTQCGNYTVTTLLSNAPRPEPLGGRARIDGTAPRRIARSNGEGRSQETWHLQDGHGAVGGQVAVQGPRSRGVMGRAGMGDGELPQCSQWQPRQGRLGDQALPDLGSCASDSRRSFIGFRVSRSVGTRL